MRPRVASRIRRRYVAEMYVRKCIRIDVITKMHTRVHVYTYISAKTRVKTSKMPSHQPVSLIVLACHTLHSLELYFLFAFDVRVMLMLHAWLTCDGPLFSFLRPHVWCHHAAVGALPRMSHLPWTTCTVRKITTMSLAHPLGPPLSKTYKPLCATFCVHCRPEHKFVSTLYTQDRSTCHHNLTKPPNEH